MKLLFPICVLVSIAAHGLIVAGLDFVGRSRNPAVSEPTLELSRVVLSVAAPTEEKPPVVSAPPPVSRGDRCETIAPPLEKAFDERLPVAEARMLEPEPTPLPRPRNPSERMEASNQAAVEAPPSPCQAIHPKYPRESRLRGEQGDVGLEIDVTDAGTVEAIRVIRSSGFVRLDEAAVEALRVARFTPAQAAGGAVAATIRLTLNFRLKR